MKLTRVEIYKKRGMMSQYVPKGSYKQTARNINVTLYTTSQKRDQSWIPSSVDVTDKNSVNIANLDGLLVIENNSGASTGYVPDGSYKRTSRDVVVILSAECQKRDQSWQYTTLVITDLTKADIANIDGVLVNEA